MPPSVMPTGPGAGRRRPPRRLPRRTRPVPIGPIPDIDTLAERAALVAEDAAVGLLGAAAGRYLDSIRWVELATWLAAVGTATRGLLEVLGVPGPAHARIVAAFVGVALVSYLRNPKRLPWAEAAGAGNAGDPAAYPAGEGGEGPDADQDPAAAGGG